MDESATKVIAELIMLLAQDLTVTALDVPLLSPFGIATGAQHVAHNLLVKLDVQGGATGYGEAAPVPHISGETQAAAQSAISDVASMLHGANLENYRPLCMKLREALLHIPSALAAVETALFDALCKSRQMSLLQWFGAAEMNLSTDITITTGTVEASRLSAATYAKAGFSQLKVKIGGARLGEDCARLSAIFEAAPHAELILDGNTAFSPADMLELLENLGPARSKVVLIEQPVPRDDFEGLREIEAKSNIPVAADESLRSEADFRTLLSIGGISAINIKTAKLGLLQAWDLLIAARRAGLKVMVGGMVETELSMTTSACLAAGIGGVEFIDLDTPMLLGPRPLEGGFVQRGPRLDLSQIALGHGVSPTSTEHPPSV